MAGACVEVGNAVLIIADGNCLCLAALSFLGSHHSRIVLVCIYILYLYFQ
jgi:hypothetical protein